MDSDSPRSSVRRHVRAERERRAWTQSDLATAAGVSRGTIANLEKGSRLLEGKEAKIEAALGKPVGWLDSLRSGRPPEAVDARDPAVEESPSEAVNPHAQFRRELAYFYDRLKDTPTDYPRLLALLDLAVRLESDPPDTQGSTRIGAHS